MLRPGENSRQRGLNFCSNYEYIFMNIDGILATAMNINLVNWK